MTLPIPCRVENGALVPLNRRAFEEALAGQSRVAVELVKERSGKSHRQYFALVKEAFDNLPEHLMTEPWAASTEHLRKFALIQAGFCKAMQVPAPDARAARSIMNAIRRLDSYAVMEVAGGVLTIWTAESQSEKAMSAKRFQQSKDAVLEVLGRLLGAELRESA